MLQEQSLITLQSGRRGIHGKNAHLHIVHTASALGFLLRDGLRESIARISVWQTCHACRTTHLADILVNELVLLDWLFHKGPPAMNT